TIMPGVNSAGQGWFYATPSGNWQFTTPGDQGDQDHRDMLFVLTSDPGQLLEHESVVDDALTASTRPVPSLGSDLFEVAVLDQLFADSETGLAGPFLDGPGL